MSKKSLLAQASVADLLPIERVLDAEYPSAWREIATCLYLKVRAWPGIGGDDHAARLGIELAEALRMEIGGSQPYLPQGVFYELSARDRAILAKFTGANHEALAREYDVSERHLYRLLRRRIREEVARRQARLPGLDEDGGES